MYMKETIVKCRIGLHARPASMLVKLSDKFKSKIEIDDGNITVSIKSMIAILGLAVKNGSRVTVKAEGEDETAAVNAVIELLETEEI